MPGIDFATRTAFAELVLMDQLSRLPVGSLLRVLKTIPDPVLEAALPPHHRRFDTPPPRER